MVPFDFNVKTTRLFSCENAGSDSVVPGGAQDPAFLTSFQGVRMLPVLTGHFGQRTIERPKLCLPLTSGAWAAQGDHSVGIMGIT